MTTIKKELASVVARNNDTLEGIVCIWERSSNYSFFHPEYDYKTSNLEIICTFDELPEEEYDAGYGLQEGPTLRAYTKNFIYFTMEYDGSEWINSLPRNPELLP